MATRIPHFPRDTAAASVKRTLREPGDVIASQKLTDRSAMRVAYLTNVYPKTSHSFIHTEIAALERAGIAVERFTIRRSGDLPADECGRAEAGRTTALLDDNRWGLIFSIFLRLLRHPRTTTASLLHALKRRPAGPGSRGLARSCAYFAEAVALANHLEQLGISHVHVHFGTNPASVARLAARMAAISYSFTAHGPDEFDAPRQLDLRGKIADAAFVAGVSSFGRGQLMRWSDPAHWNRINVVRCSVAPSFLTAPAPEPAARRLLCVARLSNQKGIPLLLEALARLAPQPHFSVHIVGDGEERAAIEAQISRLALDGHVRLLGWRAPDEVLREIAEARALVLPSFAEGLPVVLMEALAIGRPVITTNVAGIAELVDAGNGWLIPSGSIDALVDALQAALDTPPDRLHAMGMAGQARVRALHDPDRNARLLALLLKPYI